ncbi:MAG TPA: hydrogenase subunit MbhD domain-containing protein [Jiangellales bacterium]|nr:hydrogenase subunit MbhD domain-containing protein [Jiangellales bacterium]
MTGAVTVVLDAVLVTGLLAAAGFALFHPRRSAAVVMFLAFGISLAIIWARIGAPDIALAEAAIGAGVTSALMLDAVTGRRRPEPERSGRLVPAVGTALAVALAAVLAWAFLAEPGRPPPGPGALAAGRIDESGVTHGVTAVLLNFRSYDTLLEVAVLLAAVLAALSLQPEAGLGRVPDPGPAPPVLDLLGRLLAPVLVVLAGWVVVAGSSRPGGAFQAGAVLAGALLLLRLSGHPDAVPTGRWLRPSLTAGLAVFLLLAYATVLLGRDWLTLDPAWAGQAIVAVEVVLAGSIGATLAALFVANQPPAPVALARFRPAPDERHAAGARR